MRLARNEIGKNLCLTERRKSHPNGMRLKWNKMKRYAEQNKTLTEWFSCACHNLEISLTHGGGEGGKMGSRMALQPRLCNLSKTLLNKICGVSLFWCGLITFFGPVIWIWWSLHPMYVWSCAQSFSDTVYKSKVIVPFPIVIWITFDPNLGPQIGVQSGSPASTVYLSKKKLNIHFRVPQF